MKKPYVNRASRGDTVANSTISDAISKAMENPDKVLGHVEVTKVIREHMPLIQSDEYGPTIGGQIDSMLSDAAKSGDELQSFKLEFEPERWGQLVASIKKGDEEARPSY